ncbi:MAG: hypothetical protein WC263_03115 [Candidatus Micrarchaeia archaeon]
MRQIHLTKQHGAFRRLAAKAARPALVFLAAAVLAAGIISSDLRSGPVRAGTLPAHLRRFTPTLGIKGVPDSVFVPFGSGFTLGGAPYSMAFDILGKACIANCCCQFILVRSQTTGHPLLMKDPLTGKESEYAFWQFAVTARDGPIKIRVDGKDTLVKNLIFRAKLVEGGWMIAHQILDISWSETKASGVWGRFAGVPLFVK